MAQIKLNRKGKFGFFWQTFNISTNFGQKREIQRNITIILPKISWQYLVMRVSALSGRSMHTLKWFRIVFLMYFASVPT
jgi:hypothetical protein